MSFQNWSTQQPGLSVETDMALRISYILVLLHLLSFWTLGLSFFLLFYFTVYQESSSVCTTLEINLK